MCFYFVAKPGPNSTRHNQTHNYEPSSLLQLGTAPQRRPLLAISLLLLTTRALRTSFTRSAAFKCSPCRYLRRELTEPKQPEHRAVKVRILAKMQGSQKQSYAEGRGKGECQRKLSREAVAPRPTEPVRRCIIHQTPAHHTLLQRCAHTLRVRTLCIRLGRRPQRVSELTEGPDGAGCGCVECERDGASIKPERAEPRLKHPAHTATLSSQVGNKPLNSELKM